MVHVGKSEPEGRTVHVLVDPEFVGGIGGRCPVHPVGVQRLEKGIAKHRGKDIGTGRRTDKVGDAVAPVTRSQLVQFFTDLGSRLIPGDFLPAVTDALQRCRDSIGAILDRVEMGPLHADEPLTHHVLPVWFYFSDPVILYLHSQTARCLANTAEGVFCLHHG